MTNIDVGDDESDDKDSDSDSGCSVSLRSWKGDLSLSWQSGLVKIVLFTSSIDFIRKYIKVQILIHV